MNAGPRPRTMVKRLVWLAVAAAVVGLGVWLVLPQVWRPVHHVAVPPHDASPEEVVRAYVAAIDGHDCETAEALSADGSAAGWCKDLNGLEIDDLTATVRPGGTRAQVAVNLRTRVNWFKADDWGDVSGDMYWEYSLARRGSDSAWRIVNEGVG